MNTDDIIARLSKLVIPDDEAARRRQDSERREASLAAEELWMRADVPKRHAEVSLTPPPINVDHQWSKTKHAILAMLGKGFTVCLTGTRGNGKTQIGVDFIRHATSRGKSARFISAQRMFMLFKGAFDDDAKQTEIQVLDSLRRPALLVIDEIGQRTESAWENRTFFELLNARYNDMSDTILTANLAPEELQANLGPSIISRMQEGGGILRCDWPSFRK